MRDYSDDVPEHDDWFLCCLNFLLNWFLKKFFVVMLKPIVYIAYLIAILFNVFNYTL